MKTVISGFEMHYEVTGPENGPWLILIHGLAGSTVCWKHQLNEFGRHFRVLNLDLVGHGESGALPAKRYSGEIVANHIRMLMDQLGIKKAHILGLSLGTIIQQYFCEIFPDRVSSAIYASPVTKFSLVSSLFNGFSDKIFLRIFPKDLYLRFMGHLMLPGKIHMNSRKFFVRETLKMSDAEFKKWWRLVMEGNHFDFIGESDIPALIIAGSKDFCFFKDALLIRTKYRNHEFEVIKDSGHVTIFQKPEEFNRLVVDYICRLEKRELPEISRLGKAI
jgi:pimeloyl-ACP methyl ester carboxylesterase